MSDTDGATGKPLKVEPDRGNMGDQEIDRVASRVPHELNSGDRDRGGDGDLDVRAPDRSDPHGGSGYGARRDRNMELLLACPEVGEREHQVPPSPDGVAQLVLPASAEPADQLADQLEAPPPPSTARAVRTPTTTTSN
uniref:Uncharacterized protein n=1 Tax=Sphaerodactylus townsendi TaxID=933632 RepID=A0ACB8FSZ0_9SAUR